nr:unnamed protein product [Spirometra erinaceieuropaei]
MTSTFAVGEVRPATDEDVAVFRKMVDSNADWTQVFNEKQTSVFIKKTENTSVQMIKVRSLLPDVPAAVMYDVIHDPEYRKVWDKQMVEGYDICLVSPNTDIGYYSMRTFPPFNKRDFVTLRSWFSFGGTEYMVMNHSVFHAACPPRKNHVRGLSYLSGFHIRELGPTSCIFHFVSQCDPRGNIPTWAVNRCSQLVAPKSVNKLVKMARLYPEWKKTHSPDLKPWLHPEQHTLCPINWADVSQSPDFVVSEIVEEEGANGEGDTLASSAATVEVAAGANNSEMSNGEANGAESSETQSEEPDVTPTETIVPHGITVNGIPTATEG